MPAWSRSSWNRSDLESQQALNIAQSNRLDIMNNRAALVDSWRLIAFNANALQSEVTVSLERRHRPRRATTRSSSAAPTGSMRASLQIDPPFTRLLERNNYRQ